MMKNQPSRAVSTAATNPGATAGRQLNPITHVRPPEAGYRGFAAEVILIRTWLELIRMCAMTTAHGTMGGQLPQAEELLELLESAEAAIVLKIDGGQALLDSLSGWETSLLHWEMNIAPSDCMVCKRAQAIPEDLPPEYAWALRVVAAA